VLVTHSLGSVIALNGLTARLDLIRGQDVVLVTMGSPARRLMFRFFPGIFCDPASAGSLLASVTSRFRWINLFRTFDPIGAAIPVPPILNLPINDRSIGMKAHMNYWTDPRVAELLTKHIPDAVPDAPPWAAVPAHPFFDGGNISVYLSGLGLLFGNVKRVALVSAIIAVIVTSGSLLRIFRNSDWSEARGHEMRTEELAGLRARGRHASGAARCQTRLIISHVPGDQGEEYTACTIRFAISAGPGAPRTIEATRGYTGEYNLTWIMHTISISSAGTLG
jgi:hypothetical protein